MAWPRWGRVLGKIPLILDRGQLGLGLLGKFLQFRGKSPSHWTVENRVLDFSKYLQFPGKSPWYWTVDNRVLDGKFFNFAGNPLDIGLWTTASWTSLYFVSNFVGNPLDIGSETDDRVSDFSVIFLQFRGKFP